MGSDTPRKPALGKVVGVVAGATFAATGVAIVLVGGLVAGRRTAEPRRVR